MNTICLIFDRLNPGFLGPYGNTWAETPHLDRLAAESFVFDQVLVDSPDLDLLYRSYWHGWHAMRRDRPAADRPPLAALLAQQGVHCQLWTDTSAVARHPLASAFQEQIRFETSRRRVPAKSFEQTHLARCFAAIVDALEELPEPYLFWGHVGSLGTTWDAPLEYRSRYRDEDDPEPLESADAPNLLLALDHDPDQLLPLNHAYAGQVALWDQCLGGLLEYLGQARGPESTALVITAARGFPLGEHLGVGDHGQSLHGPLVQVPLLMRFPDGLGAAARSQTLVEPADLWATLLDAGQAESRPASPTGVSLLPVIRGDVESVRDRVGVVSSTERALRTPAWHFRLADLPELYAKPDDRWEVNNLAQRFPEISDSMHAILDQYVETLQSDKPDWPPLGDLLRHGT